jgi:hypothetical protein
LQLAWRLYCCLTSTGDGWEGDVYLDAKIVPPVHVDSHLHSAMSTYIFMTGMLIVVPRLGAGKQKAWLLRTLHC